MNIESFKPSSRVAKPSQDEPRLGAGHVQGTCGAEGAWVVTHVEAQTSGRQADRTSRFWSRQWKSGWAVWS